MLHSLEDLKALDIEVGYDETTTFGNYNIRVMADSDPESPREWDNLGTMVCWHSRYNLGDVDGNREYESPEAFLEEIGDAIVLPLYLYDHSGITMNTTGFSCPWDSGQVGFIYITLDKVRKEYGWKKITKKRREQIEKYLTGEVETYDMYLRGEVYGFNITRNDEDGEEVDIDSCWGFYGYDDPYMTEDVIKGAIAYDIEHTPAQLELAV
jgi:hypothetical protein